MFLKAALAITSLSLVLANPIIGYGGGPSAPPSSPPPPAAPAPQPITVYVLAQAILSSTILTYTTFPFID